MHDLTEQLPVLVYGTLRTGQSNWRRYLQGRTISERPAIAPDHKMYATNYAYVTDGPGYYVVGELMEIKPELYALVMRDLDWLEEYHPLRPDYSLYVRVQREVHVVLDQCHEARCAWIYHLNPRRLSAFSAADLVPHGDWLRHCGFDR
ncbi:MAG TPA: gamma-glutamylcyclotransferase family protein [Herpetosiphonaceae bacterium]